MIQADSGKLRWTVGTDFGGQLVRWIIVRQIKLWTKSTDFGGQKVRFFVDK